ncbi:integrase, partial [Xanthobacter sp. V3C-3]|uniref:phage integrase central domain-containing protein n=1 Tax=Xanthobacter lutulentifluminis TaxID=3119935 RepID=UPI00372BD73E
MLDGRDPSAARKLDKINAAISEGNTFETLAADDMARLAARDSAPAIIAKVKWLLEGLAGPALGKRPIAEITPVEILALLQQVERSGPRESARRLRSTIGSV